MSESDVFNCRAKISPHCYDGRRYRGWREDGTYRASSDSAVCDACYIAAGTPPNHLLEQAVRDVRKAQRVRMTP